MNEIIIDTICFSTAYFIIRTIELKYDLNFVNYIIMSVVMLFIFTAIAYFLRGFISFLLTN